MISMKFEIPTLSTEAWLGGAWLVVIGFISCILILYNTRHNHRLREPDPTVVVVAADDDSIELDDLGPQRRGLGQRESSVFSDMRDPPNLPEPTPRPGLSRRRSLHSVAVPTRLRSFSLRIPRVSEPPAGLPVAEPRQHLIVPFQRSQLSLQSQASTVRRRYRQSDMEARGSEVYRLDMDNI